MRGRIKVASFALVGVAGVVGAVCYHTQLLNNPWSSSFRVIRFGRATNAVFWVAVDYKWSLRNLVWDTREYNTTMAQIHLRSALRLREMCSRNGGLFIKVGQHIGALEYLLPKEYVQTFKLFHNRAPQTPLNHLMAVVEEELGCPVDEVFSEVSDEPLGAASLAQVHRARLCSDGSEVAIKIQHPNVRKNSYTDMDTIDFLVACVHWVFPSFRFQWLADEIRRNLPIELNFRCEAQNQDKFADMFKHLSFAKAPKVHWDLTSARLLTMEFCEGGSVNDKAYMHDHNISSDEVVLKLNQLYSEMIFQCGFVHCDPHPGNILVRCPGARDGEGTGDGVQIVLLDHGLYTELSDVFRVNYCRLWQALISEDQEAIQHYCSELQAGSLYRLLACMVTARAWANIETGITNSRRSREEMEAIQLQIPRYLAEITQLLDSVPRELVLVLKTNDLLRGIEHSLGTAEAVACRMGYLTMAKSCLLALGAHQVAVSPTWTEGLYWRIRTSLSLLVVHTYQLWLRVKHSFKTLAA